MENMIKKIVDADKEAKAMEEETLIEKEELSKKIEKESKEIYERYMTQAKITAEHNDIEEEKKAKLQWEEIQNKHKSVLIKLQSDYKLNCDKWTEQIVKRTLA